MSFPEGFEHIVRENEPLAPYTWLRVGGCARYFAEPTSLDQLIALVRSSHPLGISSRVLGGGSNLLVQDKGVEGVVISLTAPAFSRIDVVGSSIVCGGGAKLSHLVTHSVSAGLGGLEHLVGIPGTVGGALSGNAGTLNGDIGSHVQRVKLLTRQGDLIERTGKQLQFSHCKSSLDELVILEAEFGLEPSDVKSLTKRMQTIWIVKRTQQPTIEKPCGIPFIDPDANTASGLIEECGLRQDREGAVQVCSAHTGFLTTNPNATSQQVLALIDRLQETVARQAGVQLQLHLKIW